LTTLDQRCLGQEQEFFLVGEDGVLSNSAADELLAGCWEAGRSAGKNPACFAPEVSSGMNEVIVPPARSLAELSGEYLECLKLALEAGRGTGLRLYPLATYPLPISPALRDEPRYWMQAQTLGEERHLQAGGCSLTQPTSRNWSSSGSPPTTPGSRPWTAQGWSVGSFSTFSLARCVSEPPLLHHRLPPVHEGLLEPHYYHPCHDDQRGADKKPTQRPERQIRFAGR
jgi:hypothetical protein